MSDSSKPVSSRPRSRRLGGPPLRVGFVVDWLEDPYQGAVLLGAAQAAGERGVNLTVIPGGVLGGAHRNGTQRNQLYQLITRDRFDALVVMTGTLGNHLGEDVVAALCPDFPRNRVCSVAIALDDSPSVLIDNRRGTQSAVEHLVREHQHSKIAFVRGPTTNVEAEERYWAYKDVLEAHGIEYEEKLVCSGDFQRASGTLAVITLFDERGLGVDDIDCIVAADDLMCLGVLDELKRRKIRVPEQIALMGFDDIEEARYANPPLSTVRQPFVEQGREAVRVALAAITGHGDTDAHMLATTDHFRRSCGCIPEDDSYYTERPPMSTRLDLEASLVRQRELILAQLTRSARGGFLGAGRGWEVKLYNALYDDLKGLDHAFRIAFAHLLQQVLDAGGDVAIGHAVISGLRRELSIAAGASTAHLRQVETLLHDARILTSEIVERYQAGRRIHLEAWSRILGEVSSHLVATYHLSDLAEGIAKHLPRLGIKSCYISRYSEEGPHRAELLMGYGSWGKLASDADPIAFDSIDLLPPSLLSADDHASLVIEPLATDTEQFGFVIFEYGGVESYVYEVLRDLLTVALRSSLHTR